MKQSKELDSACIKRILKYIQAIRGAYNTFNIESADDLAGNDICQLAITQAITNIYQLQQKIQPETLVRLPIFQGLKLKGARNIASHDYDSLDFDIIYKRTRQLLGRELFDELESIKSDIEQPDKSN